VVLDTRARDEDQTRLGAERYRPLCGFSAGSPADSRPQLVRAPDGTARCSRHLWAGVVWCDGAPVGWHSRGGRFDSCPDLPEFGARLSERPHAKCLRGAWVSTGGCHVRAAPSILREKQDYSGNRRRTLCWPPTRSLTRTTSRTTPKK